MSAAALTILYCEQNFNFAVCLSPFLTPLFRLISFEGYHYFGLAGLITLRVLAKS